MDKSIHGLMGILLVAFAGTGCFAQTGEDIEEGPEADAEEVEVGEASDALTPYWWSHFGTAANSWGLGSLAGTGFLMGLTGNLGNGGATPAYAEVADSPSQIVWHHNPVGGRALGSYVGTVQPSSGETAIKSITTSGGQLTKDLEVKLFGAKRRCMLTAVRNSSSTHNAFANVGDALEILDVAGKFQFRSTGRAAGSARCITVNDVVYQASWAWSSVDADLPMDPNEAGKQCYLTGIGGSFRANNYNKGVYVWLNPSNDTWYLHVSANMFGSAECSI